MVDVVTAKQQEKMPPTEAAPVLSDAAKDGKPKDTPIVNATLGSGKAVDLGIVKQLNSVEKNSVLAAFPSAESILAQADVSPIGTDTKTDTKTIEGAPKVQDQALTPEQQKVVKGIEATMLQYLLYFAGSTPDGKSDPSAVTAAQQILNTDNGNFGDAAKQLYSKYLVWMQTQNGPQLLKQLEDKGLPLPDGAPNFKSPTLDDVFVQASHSNSPALAPIAEPNADENQKLAQAKDVEIDLGIDPTKIPGKEDADKLQNTLAWMTRASNSLLAANQKVVDKQMVEDLKSYGFSKAFFPPPRTSTTSLRTDQIENDAQRENWQNNTEVALDLAHEMRRYSEATLSLRDAGYYDKLKMPLPPGVTENPPGHLNYDLPTDPRMNTVENQQRLKAFSDWQKQYGGDIDQTLMRVELNKLNPDQMLSWGDIELQGESAVFDKSGQFQSLAKRGSYVPKNGETVQDVNLMQNHFDVHTEKDAQGNDVIVVLQQVQAQQVADWGYQNWIGVSNVGKPYQPSEQRYKPEDFVPISTPDGMKLIQARDLSSYKFSQQFQQYGSKVLIATMDGAMLASSVIGVGEVAAGVRVLVAGEELAGKVTAKDLTIDGLKMGLRLTAAAAGTFNNAGAKDTNWGSTINTLRGYYFMGDIAAGAGAAPLRKLLGLSQDADSSAEVFLGGAPLAATSSGERIEKFMQSQFKKSPILGAVNTGTNWAFKVTEYGIVPQITSDNFTELKRIFGKHQSDTLSDSWRYLSDSPGLKVAKPGDFDVTQSNTLQGTTDLLSNYENVLSRDNKGAGKVQVQQILDQTKEVLSLEAAGDPTSGAKKQALINELINQEQFNGAEVSAMNSYNRYTIEPDEGLRAGKPLTGQDLDDLYAGKIPSWMGIEKGEHFKQMAEAAMKARDQDVEAARRVALLYLARNQDGALPSTIGTVKTALPIPMTLIDTEQQYYGGTISIQTNDLVNRLESLVSDPNPATGYVASNKSLVVGDTLTRIGAISYGQYASLLKDVLASPNTSKEDKIQAMLGGQGLDMGTLITGLTAGQGSTTNTGYDALQLLKGLDSAAANRDFDPDVRGIAAMLRFGLAPENAAVLPALLAAARKSVNSSGEVPAGAFANSAAQYLEYRALNTPAGVTVDDSELQKRLAAARALRQLGADNSTFAATAIQGLAEVATNSQSSPLTQAQAIEDLVKPVKQAGATTYDIDNLKKTNPDLAASVLTAYVTATKNAVQAALKSGQGQAETALSLLDASTIANRLSPEQTADLVASLKEDYLAAISDTSDSAVLVKKETLLTLSQLSPGTSLTTLATAAGLSSGNGIELSAEVRQTALSLLNKAHYEKMPELLAQISRTEADPAVQKTIADLSYAYNTYGPAASAETAAERQNTPGKDDFETASQATTGDAKQILDRTRNIIQMVRSGDPAAASTKQELVTQLVAQEQFGTDEINEMNQYLRTPESTYSPTYGRTLSAQDLSDLYSGKTPDWLAQDQSRAQHLKQMAEGFLAKRDPGLSEVRHLSLLTLLRQADGTLPATIGAATVTFSVPLAASNGTNGQTYTGQTYTQVVSLSTDAVLSRLKSELNSDQSTLAISLRDIAQPLLKDNGQAAPAITDAQKEWLHNHFPLLLASDYEPAAIETANDSLSRWAKIFSSNQAIEKAGMQSLVPLEDDREHQWSQLVQLAMSPTSSVQQTVEDIDTAKQILFSIIKNGGQPLGTAGNGDINWDKHQVTGTDPTDPLFNPGKQWQIKAAQALVLASHPGVDGREQVESFLEDAITGGDNIPPEARLILLKAWHDYYSPLKILDTTGGAGSSFVSLEEYTQVLQSAYRAERKRAQRGFGDVKYEAQLQVALNELQIPLPTGILSPLIAPSV
jgi:hypothetical protein